MTKRRPEGIALAAGLAEPAGSLIGTQSMFVSLPQGRCQARNR